MCKIAIRTAGMKQNYIAGVLNVSHSVVSRPLKEHRESSSITKWRQFTLILECKEFLLKHLVRGALSDDHLIQLKCGYWDFERSKVPGRNPGMC